MLFNFVDLEPCILNFSEHIRRNPGDIFRCYDVGLYNWKSSSFLRRSYDLEEFVKILRNIGHWENFEEQLRTFAVNQIRLHCHTNNGSIRPHCELEVSCHQKENICTKQVPVQSAHSDGGWKSGTSLNSANRLVMMNMIVVIVVRILTR